MNKLYTKPFFVIIALILVAVVPILTSCTSSTSATTAPATTTPATSQVPPSQTATPTTTAATSPTASNQPEKTLNIGSLVALSSPQGLEIQRWDNLFAKLVNDAGGLKVGNQTYKIDWHVYDVGYSDPNATTTAVQKAIYQDGVTIFLNDFGDATDVTANLCDPNKVLQISVGFIDSVVGPKYQYYFRPNGGFFTQGTPYGFSMDYKKEGAKTYVVATNDDQQGQYSGQLEEAGAKLAGLTVLPGIFFADNTVDFGPIATKIMSEGADVVDMVDNTAAEDVALISALKSAGWKGYIWPGAGLDTTTLANLVKQVGASYVEGMEVLDTDPRQIPSTIQDPYLESLIQAYTQAYGTFRTDGAFWVGSWFVLQDAIKATQSVDTTVLKDYLEKGPPATQTFTGYTQLFARPDIGQDRTTDGPPGSGVGIVHNGQMVYLRQQTVQDMYLLTIKSLNMVDVYAAYWNKYGRPTFPPENSTYTYADVLAGYTPTPTSTSTATPTTTP